MKYGCIGEHLIHSFSREIHALIADYEYELLEIPKNGLEAFMKSGDFLAINVTIPYKRAVMPYLDEIDGDALAIGAVNTVVNENGRLRGFNTDFGGMKALMENSGVDLRGAKVLIAGTGGTSRTAMAVANALGAARIIRLGRTGSDGSLTYERGCREHSDARVLINTTPCGMFPDNDSVPVELERLPCLAGVFDAVYNPLRTRLVQQARERGIPARGGLYMLVAQAVLASEKFLGKKHPDGMIDEVYRRIRQRKENIVLIGMPSSGKTTVGGLLSRMSGRELVDTDELVTAGAGMPITEVFERYGEGRFRDMESDAVALAARRNGVIIATGGGVVLKPENMQRLAQNGRIYYLDRPLEQLVPSKDRPLALSADDVKKRFDERHDIYRTAADRIIDNAGTAEQAAKAIMEDIKV